MTGLDSPTPGLISNEDIVTQRHLRFLEQLLFLAKEDPEWKKTLEEKARQVAEREEETHSIELVLLGVEGKA